MNAAPPAGPRPWLASDRQCLLILLLVAAALWLPRLRGPIDLRYDGGAYYVLGTSLAEGRGYRLLNEPGEIEAIQYPPLLPLLVAAHQWALGSDDPVPVGEWLRLCYMLLSVACTLATYALCRELLPARHALLATLFSSLAVYTYFLSDLCFAETPFTLTTTLFVIAVRRPGRLALVLQAVLAAASFLLRTLGIALLFAWVGESLLARRYRQAATRAAVALVPVLLWQGYIQEVRSGPEYQAQSYAYQRADYQYYNVGYFENLSYIDPFAPELGKASSADWARRLGTNLLRMPAAWGEAVSSRAEWSTSQIQRLNHSRSLAIPTWLVQVPLLALGVLISWGLFLLALRGETLIPLYVAGSVAIMARHLLS